jgi:disulfide bond formation protein DsbB
MLPGVDVEAVQLFTSLLALLAGAGAIALGGARLLARSSAPVAAFVAAIDDVALWLAFLVAATATAGSLYFSEHAHFIPCNLCWYQRVAMYPLSLLLLIAAIRRDRAVRWYVGPLAGAGAVISTYHYLVEWFPSLENEDVCSVSVPCTTPWFRELGFVTLSFMALCGFLLILVLVVPRRAAHLAPEAS